jgi:hypothetical protein
VILAAFFGLISRIILKQRPLLRVISIGLVKRDLLLRGMGYFAVLWGHSQFGLQIYLQIREFYLIFLFDHNFCAVCVAGFLNIHKQFLVLFLKIGRLFRPFYSLFIYILFVFASNVQIRSRMDLSFTRNSFFATIIRFSYVSVIKNVALLHF